MSMNSSALCQVSSLETLPAGIMGVREDGDLTSLQEEAGPRVQRQEHKALACESLCSNTADYGILHDHHLKQLQSRT